ncbi:right-handed parallel beta-helix repeat-containing protein [Haloarchaeobius sp. DFWS5]|uniref:right-handed parallel beta-helix repeat-containing protein n=1 Tax=Haloarchaeobius sp. DFWS5 TaxID=3446114 RepID=UPI003EBFBC47
MLRRHTLILAIAGLLVLSPLAAAGVGVSPDATVGTPSTDLSTDTSTVDATEVTSCRVIDEPGQYELTTDITNSTAETCIEIAASDVTFDGNGHTIDGDDDASGPETAIGPPSGTPDEWQNVTVRDVTVTDWSFGIRFLSVENGSVEDVTARDGQWGINLESSDVTVSNSTIENNSFTGVQVAGSAWGTEWDVTLDGNTFVDNAKGVRALLEDDASLQVRQNVFQNNDDGLWAHHAVNLTVRQNLFTENTNGVNVASTATLWRDRCETPPMAEGVAIHQNAFVNNTDYGVYNDAGATVNATQNYWGAADGASSPADPNGSLVDPVTEALADGTGDKVSEGPKEGLSNVHFDDALPQMPGNMGTDDDDSD